MDPVKPEAPTNPNWESVTYAENQPEYQPLPAVRNRNVERVPVISCWVLSEEEIAYIMKCEEEGVPARLYHEQWVGMDDTDPNFPEVNPLQPIRMWVGKREDEEDGPWS